LPPFRPPPSALLPDGTPTDAIAVLLSPAFSMAPIERSLGVLDLIRGLRLRGIFALAILAKQSGIAFRAVFAWECAGCQVRERRRSKKDRDSQHPQLCREDKPAAVDNVADGSGSKCEQEKTAVQRRSGSTICTGLLLSDVMSQAAPTLDIAQMIGVTRETVARALSRFRKWRIAGKRASVLTIHDTVAGEKRKNELETPDFAYLQATRITSRSGGTSVPDDERCRCMSR